MHSAHFSTGRVIARDPDGRYLAVYVLIHMRPSLIVAIHADCGAGQAASLKRALDAIAPARPPGTLDTHLMIDTNSHACPLDYHRFAYSPTDPALESNPAGTSALGDLTLRSVDSVMLSVAATQMRKNSLTHTMIMVQSTLNPGSTVITYPPPSSRALPPLA